MRYLRIIIKSNGRVSVRNVVLAAAELTEIINDNNVHYHRWSEREVGNGTTAARTTASRTVTQDVLTERDR